VGVISALMAHVKLVIARQQCATFNEKLFTRVAL